MNAGRPLVLIRGGGDLATGVAARLHRSGFPLLVTEIEHPLALRRLVALAEAVYSVRVEIEDLRARRSEGLDDLEPIWAEGEIPVLVDAEAACRRELEPAALVDARMRKAPPEIGREAAPFVVGLGPGFTAGVDCHAVVETNRGHHLGRVLWEGAAEGDTGVPEPVRGHDAGRVLRAPVAGEVRAEVELGAVVEREEILAWVGEHAVRAPFRGALRGLVHPGLRVGAGDKIGDLDPRAMPAYCFEISDKALAVGGGVLEALLSRPSIRAELGA